MKFWKFTFPWPYLALIGAHLIWGANTVVAKITLQEFPVMSLSFLRFSLACLLLAPFFINLNLHKGDKSAIHINSKDLPKLFLASFLMITATIALGYEGLNRTTAIDASVLSLSIPIISVIVGWWFLKEHIYWINLLGILLGLVGAFVILGFPLVLFGNFNTGNLLGDFLIILSGITFVSGTVFAKDLLAKYPTLVVTGFAFLVAVILFAIPAANDYIQNPTWIYKVTIIGIMGLTFITILTSVCAFFMMEWGLKKTNIVKAHLFQYIEPAVAATLAVPILGERISYSFIVGTVLIILGVYWGTLGKPQHHHLHHRHHRN